VLTGLMSCSWLSGGLAHLSHSEGQGNSRCWRYSWDHRAGLVWGNTVIPWLGLLNLAFRTLWWKSGTV